MLIKRDVAVITYFFGEKVVCILTLEVAIEILMR